MEFESRRACLSDAQRSGRHAWHDFTPRREKYQALFVGRRVHFKLGAGPTMEIAATPAKPTVVSYAQTWKCALARLRSRAPSTGLDARPHASPVHRAPFRSRRTSSSGDPTAARRPSEPDSRPAPASRRRSRAPSTGLAAGQHASPVHRAPFRSRRTSSSGDPTAARRPSEPDSRPAAAARRAIAIAVSTAKPNPRGLRS